MGFEDDCASAGRGIFRKSGHEALGQYTSTERFQRHSVGSSLLQELFGTLLLRAVSIWRLLYSVVSMSQFDALFDRSLSSFNGSADRTEAGSVGEDSAT